MTSMIQPGSMVRIVILRPAVLAVPAFLPIVHHSSRLLLVDPPVEKLHFHAVYEASNADDGLGSVIHGGSNVWFGCFLDIPFLEAGDDVLVCESVVIYPAAIDVSLNWTMAKAEVQWGPINGKIITAVVVFEFLQVPRILTWE